MSEIKITLAQLYLGLLNSFMAVMRENPELPWSKLMDKAIKDFVCNAKNKVFYLQDGLPATENVILRMIKQHPQIKIIEFEGEE
jgi:hypothetical protein